MEQKSADALKYAMRILNRKDYTVYQMRKKLKEKGFSDEEIDEVVGHLLEVNLLNDDRYAENFVYFKLKDGYGKRRIAYELKDRGVDENIVDKWLDGVDELGFASALVKAKVGSRKITLKEKGKLYAFLARRGYDYDTINEVLNKEVEYEVQ